MARSNALHTRTINYLELIGNGKHYRVPPYQRDYSWSEEQWEDLWNDLVDLRADPEERHYLGALVIEERGDREFLIIDGQQRLATLSVLALAVIARLQRSGNRGTRGACRSPIGCSGSACRPSTTAWTSCPTCGTTAEP